MKRITKLIIILVACIILSLVVMFGDVIWSALLLSVFFVNGYLIKFIFILKNFFFKKGIVSFATIAWRHVLVSSFFALSKRAIMNTISGFFQNRVVKPLITPLTRYLKIRWKIFKASNYLKKFITVLFGTIPASLGLWLVGVGDAIALLMKSLSLAKFLSFILKFISVFFLFFQSFWRNWIQPYIDIIIVTIFITYIEKVPFIGPLFRRTRITIRWKLRYFRARKASILENHIDRPINKLTDHLNKHVDKKKEDLKSFEGKASTKNTKDKKKVKDKKESKDNSKD